MSFKKPAPIPASNKPSSKIFKPGATPQVMIDDPIIGVATIDGRADLVYICSLIQQIAVHTTLEDKLW
jgi:hypothetical protein